MLPSDDVSVIFHPYLYEFQLKSRGFEWRAVYGWQSASINSCFPGGWRANAMRIR